MKTINFIKDYKIKEYKITILLVIIIIIFIITSNVFLNKIDTKQKQLIAQNNIIKELVDTPASDLDNLFNSIQEQNKKADGIQEYISLTKEDISTAELEFAEAIIYRDCLTAQIGRIVEGEEVDLNYCLTK